MRLLWLGAVALLASILWCTFPLPSTSAPHDRTFLVASVGGAGALVAVAIALAEKSQSGMGLHFLSAAQSSWELGVLAACAVIITGVIGVRSMLVETEAELHRSQAQRARQRRRELQERQRMARREAIALRRDEVARKRNRQ